MHFIRLSVRSSVRGQLVKMLITLEPHDIFGSKAYFFSIKIVQPLVCKPTFETTFFDGRVFAEHQSSGLWSVSEKAHNS